MTDRQMLDILSTFSQATDESKPLTEGKRTVTADTAMADILGKLNTLNESAEPVITEGKMPSKKHVMDMCKDGMSKKEMCDMHPDCDQGKLKDMIDDCKEEMKDSKEEMDEASCGSSMRKNKKMKESAIAEGVAQIEVRLTEAFKIFNEKPATSYSAPISSAGGSIKGSYGQSEKTPKVMAKPATPPKAPKLAPAVGQVAAKPATPPKAPKPQRDQSYQGEKTPKVIAKPETPSSPLAKIGKSPKAADPKSAADFIAKLQGSGDSENPWAKYQGSGGSGDSEPQTYITRGPTIPGAGTSLRGQIDDYIAKSGGSGDSENPWAKYQKKSTKSPEEIFDIYREQIASLREQIASLSEGSMKDMMHRDAERMSREDFVEKHGEEHGEFWDAVMGDLDEGNAFSGALAQAQQDGKAEFEVDGKKYKVTEMFDKQDEVGSKKKTKHGTAEKTATGMKHTRDYKPDYLDLDGDGDKKEPMKKAAKDKKAKEKK